MCLKGERTKQVKLQQKVQGYSPFLETGFCGEPFSPIMHPTDHISTRTGEREVKKREESKKVN